MPKSALNGSTLTEGWRDKGRNGRLSSQGLARSKGKGSRTREKDPSGSDVTARVQEERRAQP